jgi:hypothetical protein
MEPGWNPMLERQALDRVHRLGQKLPVISRRYIVEGKDSIEEVSGNLHYLVFRTKGNLVHASPAGTEIRNDCLIPGRHRSYEAGFWNPAGKQKENVDSSIVRLLTVPQEFRQVID